MKETRHLGVYAAIIENDSILLVKKARGAYLGKLDLPGGSIEHGEKPEETLKRELKEETNCDIKDAKLIDANSVVVNWLHHRENENMHHIGIIYKVSLLTHNIKKDADGLDSLGAIWYKIKDLNKEIISPLTLETLELLGYKIK